MPALIPTSWGQTRVFFNCMVAYTECGSSEQFKMKGGNWVCLESWRGCWKSLIEWTAHYVWETHGCCLLECKCLHKLCLLSFLKEVKSRENTKRENYGWKATMALGRGRPNGRMSRSENSSSGVFIHCVFCWLWLFAAGCGEMWNQSARRCLHVTRACCLAVFTLQSPTEDRKRPNNKDMTQFTGLNYYAQILAQIASLLLSAAVSFISEVFLLSHQCSKDVKNR